MGERLPNEKLAITESMLDVITSDRADTPPRKTKRRSLRRRTPRRRESTPIPRPGPGGFFNFTQNWYERVKHDVRCKLTMLGQLVPIINFSVSNEET